MWKAMMRIGDKNGRDSEKKQAETARASVGGFHS